MNGLPLAGLPPDIRRADLAGDIFQQVDRGLVQLRHNRPTCIQNFERAAALALQAGSRFLSAEAVGNDKGFADS